MKTFAMIVLSLSLTACTTLTAQKVATPAPTMVSQTVNEQTANKTEQTHILYYEVDPVHMGQAASAVSGTWFWQNHCLYLATGNGIFTARFPALPKNSVVWNEENQLLTLNNIDNKTLTFKMGEYIITNGSWFKPSPEYIAETVPDQRHCISPAGVMDVGTISMSKNFY